MARKKFIALARVSSREQEREGFSLDIQEDALQRDAERRNGKIIKLWRIAETASKSDERRTFKELVAFAKRHAADLDGILFHKIDRAARNLFDYVELERLESEFHVPFFSVTQPTENSPSGRMQRRMLASMASYYTEQQSLDVREGVKRRVECGLFPQKAAYGYAQRWDALLVQHGLGRGRQDHRARAVRRRCRLLRDGLRGPEE